MISKFPNKKENINLRNLLNKNYQDDFIVIFCNKFLPRLKEFEQIYTKALWKGDSETLRLEVHTISSSLRFIEMENFCTLLSEYKSIDSGNKEEVQELADEVHEYCTVLEEKLLEFRDDYNATH